MREYWGSGYNPMGSGGGGGSSIIVITTLDPLQSGNLVTLVPGSGSARLANADITLSPSRYDICGVAIVAAAIGVMTPIYTGMGSNVPIRFLAPPLATDNGSRVWLSPVPGFATLIPPGNGNWAQSFVGVLQGADGITLTPKVLFQPRLVALLR